MFLTPFCNEIGGVNLHFLALRPIATFCSDLTAPPSLQRRPFHDVTVTVPAVLYMHHHPLQWCQPSIPAAPSPQRHLHNALGTSFQPYNAKLIVEASHYTRSKDGPASRLPRTMNVRHDLRVCVPGGSERLTARTRHCGNGSGSGSLQSTARSNCYRSARIVL